MGPDRRRRLARGEAGRNRDNAGALRPLVGVLDHRPGRFRRGAPALRPAVRHRRRPDPARQRGGAGRRWCCHDGDGGRALAGGHRPLRLPRLVGGVHLSAGAAGGRSGKRPAVLREACRLHRRRARARGHGPAGRAVPPLCAGRVGAETRRSPVRRPVLPCRCRIGRRASPRSGGPGPCTATWWCATLGARSRWWAGTCRTWWCSGACPVTWPAGCCPHRPGSHPSCWSSRPGIKADASCAGD